MEKGVIPSAYCHLSSDEEKSEGLLQTNCLSIMSCSSSRAQDSSWRQWWMATLCFGTVPPFWSMTEVERWLWSYWTQKKKKRKKSPSKTTSDVSPFLWGTYSHTAPDEKIKSPNVQHMVLFQLTRFDPLSWDTDSCVPFAEGVIVKGLQQKVHKRVCLPHLLQRTYISSLYFFSESIGKLLTSSSRRDQRVADNSIRAALGKIIPSGILPLQSLCKEWNPQWQTGQLLTGDVPERWNKSHCLNSSWRSWLIGMTGLRS